MSDKFQNKYRISSARLQNWDYGWNAAYFITICIQNRECYFGKIVDDQMILSEIGTIAQQYWNLIPTHFPFVELGEFVVISNFYRLFLSDFEFQRATHLSLILNVYRALHCFHLYN